MNPVRTTPTLFTMLALLAGCAGTDTGNPAVSAAPKGVEFIRSKLLRDEEPDVAADLVTQLGTDNQDFAYAFYEQVAAASQGNLFFSPYSISEALAMLYAGARGVTESEMAGALRFELSQSQLHPAFNAVDQQLAARADQVPRSAGGWSPQAGDGLRLSVLNAAWTQQGFDFLTDYLDLLARDYGAGMYTLDFTRQPELARGRINEWVSEQTAGRITELLPPMSITGKERLVLTNAIYFKAFWLNRFIKSSTRDDVFHAPTADVTVPMMHGDRGLYAAGDGYQAIALPYVSQAVRMLFVMPAEGRFEEIEAGFDRAFVDTIRGGLAQPAALRLTLPRFRYEVALDAREALNMLGMRQAFDPAAADFSGMATRRGVYVDRVLHKAYIAIDEDGTEAGAATAVGTSAGTSPPPVEIVFNRPFLYLIYDEPTGQVLFLGRLMDPR